MVLECHNGRANQMSQEGKKYEEILKHYYTGVELSNILNEPQK
jgi:peptidoglycan hydrolase-like amidase